MSDVFAMFARRILMGKKIKLGYGLGSLCMRRIYRKTDYLSIDFNETNKLRKTLTQEEIDNRKHIVYRTNDYYFSFKWLKNDLPCFRFVAVYKNLRNINKHLDYLEYNV